MSRLFTLTRNPGARKHAKRIGRGNAAGGGTSAGRGRKGQKQRSGGKIRPGFEGGQTPLTRRMPKLKGFNNPNRLPFTVVNVEALNAFEENATVDTVALYEKKLIKKKKLPVKILGDGELTKKLFLKVDRVSKSAKEKIEKKGGEVEELIKETNV